MDNSVGFSRHEIFQVVSREALHLKNHANIKSRSARTCYSLLKLSDLVGYLDATDRVPARTVVVVHTGVADAEAEVLGAVAARSWS